MKKFNIPYKVIFFSLLLSLIFPLFFVLFLSPAIDEVMFTESREEAFRLAEHIIDSMGLIEGQEISSGIVTERFSKEMNDIRKQFNLYKISVLSGEGEVIFSTDSRDVGNIAHGKLFADTVLRGEKYALFQKRGAVSIESVTLSHDVIEAYVPVVKAGRVAGVVEVYYDVNEAQGMFRNLKILTALSLFFISSVLMTFVVIIFIKAERRRIKQEEAERELSQEQIKAETVFSAMGDNIIIQDRDYRIIYQNKLNRESYGDHKGEYCYKVYEGQNSVCEGCPVELTYQDGMNHRTERLVQTDQGLRYFELTSSPLRNTSGEIIAGIKLVREITEGRRVEEQLRHAQKMEALGTLTSGISHEFNNVLTSIIGYTEILREELPLDSNLRKYADIILESGIRAEKLTKGLLAYSRKQVMIKEPLHLNEIVRHVEELLRKIIGPEIRIQSVLHSDDLTVAADRNQIEQALFNVMTNAVDAMPGGGKLTMRTEITEIDDSFIRKKGYGKPGRYALISVRDSGHGMDEYTRSKIFEPFFTTKDVGKGTGLGLAIVYGIVKNHDGFIDVVSESGKGTTVLMYLPLYQKKS